MDVALDREPFFTASEQVLRFVEQQKVEGYVSASSFSDLYYIIRKAKSHTWTIQFLQGIANFCRVATVNQAIISMALTSNFKDFEDAVLYGTALLNNLDAIVTRINTGRINSRAIVGLKIFCECTEPENSN